MCEALKIYLKRNRLSISAAARQLGEHRETVRTWVRGLVVPRKQQMPKIYHWSKGQVEPNDFYDLSPASAHDELPLFANGHGREAGAKHS